MAATASDGNQIADDLPSLLATASSLLARRKEEAGYLDSAADTVAGWLGETSKWRPLESELSKLQGAEDSQANRLRAVSLIRSLGGSYAIKGQTPGQEAGDAGDAGVRAATQTFDKDLAAEVSKRSKGLGGMIPPSILYGGGAILAGAAIAGVSPLLGLAGILGGGFYLYEKFKG